MDTMNNNKKDNRFADAIRSILKNPKVRHGGYASIITFAVIVAVIVINLLVSQLGVQLDMTEHNVYTLSDQSRAILRELDEDVTIYVLARRNQEPAQIMEALGRYAQASSHIRIEIMDADTNPGFVSQYDPEGAGLGNGSVIVAGQDNYKPIGMMDLYSVDTRNPQAPSVLGLNVERRVTNALIYVATGSTPIIYQTTGRGEAQVEQVGEMAAALQAENYEVRSINLITAPQVPEDGAILLVFGPQADFSEGEVQKIRTFLESGGNAIFMLDFLAGEVPVLNELLSAYGVVLQDGVIIEGNPNYHAPDNQFLYMLDMPDHPTTAPLVEARSPVLMQYARPVEILSSGPRDVTVEPVLMTSIGSYLRTDLSNQDTDMSSDDVAGPFATAAAAIHRDFSANEEISRIVVMGNAMFMGPILSYNYVPGNQDFFLNAVGWVQNQEEALSIRSKTTLQLPMQLTAIQVLIFAGLFVIVIPLGILVAGLIVWLRRRHL